MTARKANKRNLGTLGWACMTREKNPRFVMSRRYCGIWEHDLDNLTRITIHYMPIRTRKDARFIAKEFNKAVRAHRLSNYVHPVKIELTIVEEQK